MDFGQRLIKARETLGFNQSNFAEKINLAPQSLTRYEKNKTVPSMDFIAKLTNMFSINSNWLLTGKGEILLNDTQYKDKTQNNLIQIQYFKDTYAAAGDGAINYDEAPTLLAFDKKFLKIYLGLNSFNNIHIINATGNSMEPTLMAGELLFISPIENENNYVREGGIYIIRCEDSILVKRVFKDNINKEITLISDNTIYPPKTIKLDDFTNCQIIGRVIGHFSGL